MIVRIPDKAKAEEAEKARAQAKAGMAVDELIAVGEQINMDRVSPRIHVDSRPSGAKVTRDGVGLGRTPLWIRIPAGRGELALQLERPGYTMRRLILERGGPSKYLVGLDPRPLN